MNFQARYQQAITQSGFEPDDAQYKAVLALDQTRGGLLEKDQAGLLTRLRHRFAPQPEALAPVKGVYLWGGVGRGKTFVMDLFFESLPFDDKLRFHFHRLMYRVHRDLKKLKHPDPLELVAEDIAAQARIICFDEFFVSDIGDAMLLGKLLDALFRRGVTLVATSNIPPHELYLDGLQRQNFLPAIKLIERHTQITHVDGATDFRLRVLKRAEIYHSPLDSAAETNLAKYFEQIAPDAGTSNQPIEILGRNISTRRRADGIAWFDFDALCDGPRSQDDYIEIARSFQTIILSALPRLDKDKEDQARRFIAAVDEFYDRRVNLIISAEQSIDNIYSGKRLSHEFARTRSRLREMQSNEYLAASHRP